MNIRAATTCCVALGLGLGSPSHGADLSGTYDVGTLTPLQRPEAFGDSLYLTEQQADAMRQRWSKLLAADSASSDPDRAAPPKGSFSNGYNFFWVDPGSQATVVDGRFRTSIITEPANGRIPPMTEHGAARLRNMLDGWQIVWRDPDPTTEMDATRAWWLEQGNGTGPYDHLEQRPLAERCIIGSRSTAGPPMLPNVYNNQKRIVQTRDSIMILTEMNHDARVIRMNAEHRPAHIRSWLGDSIGRWEDGVLVVETANFNDTPALSGADRHLRVEERFQKLDNGNLHYQFTVDNPTIWQTPWRGEYTWTVSAGRVYEYACHEGNYALGNVMRGARQLERDQRELQYGE